MDLDKLWLDYNMGRDCPLPRKLDITAVAEIICHKLGVRKSVRALGGFIKWIDNGWEGSDHTVGQRAKRQVRREEHECTL